MPWTLSQSADAPARLSQEMLFWSAVFMAILVVAWIVIVIAKRRSEAYRQQGGASLAFSLHDLREMHEAGQLTEEEFRKARDKIVALSKAQLADATDEEAATHSDDSAWREAAGPSDSPRVRGGDAPADGLDRPDSLPDGDSRPPSG